MGRYRFLLNSTFQIVSNVSFSQLLPTYETALNYPYNYALNMDNLLTSSSLFTKFLNNNVVTTHITSNSYIHMAFSPDFNFLFIWNYYSTFKVLDANSLTPLLTITPNNTPTLNSTQKVTFSSDSSLAILETDSHNPIAIYNLTSLTEEWTITIPDIIHSAHFLNDSNQFIIVFGTNSTTLVDILTGTHYPISHIPTTDSTVDYSNQVFTCHNNLLQQLLITTAAIPP